MKNTPENPPAFPAPPNPNYTDDANLGQRGMTLRDWFAGQFAAAMVGDPHSTAVVSGMADKENARPTDAMAGIAYDLADSLLREREKVRP